METMQHLIEVIDRSATSINMSCNPSKTVAMAFAPSNHRWRIRSVFPDFKMGSSSIKFVTHFKYLGHIISHSFNDDDDIDREIRNTFVRSNVILRKFCSLNVKSILFRTYC